MACGIFSLDGADLGSFMCSSDFELDLIDNVLYAEYGGMGWFVCTRLTEGMPHIDIEFTDDYSAEKLSYNADVYDENGVCTQTLNGISDEELRDIQKQMGYDTDMITSGNKFKEYSYGTLCVPDENYTQEDIQSCFEELLTEYAAALEQ